MYLISKKERSLKGEIKISGSKSESNRLLILRAYSSFFKIINLSDSDDTKTMLSALKSEDENIDINHAGTAMRFLTSYYSSIINSSKILTGSARMKQRPISILVDALNKMDLPVVMGSVLFIASIFVIINIIVDLIYGWLDPRIRIS